MKDVGFVPNGCKGQTWVKDEGDKNATEMYVKAYLEPTFQSHATSYGWGHDYSIRKRVVIPSTTRLRRKLGMRCFMVTI